MTTKDINDLKVFAKSNNFYLVNNNNNTLIYVSDITKWGKDTNYGEYSISEEANYKLFFITINSDALYYTDEYNYKWSNNSADTVVTSYNSEKALSTGSSLEDLLDFCAHEMELNPNLELYTSLEDYLEINDNYEEFKLCYVSNNIAYFSNDPEQWGDDWDDKPYECNAGIPYPREEYDIIPISYFTNNCYIEPCYYFTCTPLSVEEINKGFAPWLVPQESEYNPILAGATISKFKELVNSCNGTILTKLSK